MSDLLNSGSEWLGVTMRAHAAASVTYTRGSGSYALEAEGVAATIGRTVFEVTDDYGLLTRVESRDYLIDAAELEAFGEPQRGDQIRETLGGAVQVFEVMAPSGEDHFRYSDAYRRTYRIHTKRVGAEP